MPMQYEYTAIPEAQVPRASNPIFQHLLDTYASETSKVTSVWRQFNAEDMGFKPAERSSSVLDIMKHQLLSERRFFAEFIGLPGEPEAAALLPQGVPVIRVLRTVFDTGDVLVEVQDTVAAAGRREFRSEVSLNGNGGPGPR